jgi:AMOP domain
MFMQLAFKQLIGLALLVGFSIALYPTPLFQMIKIRLLPAQALRDARAIAHQLREEYPGWQDRLDPCPCTRVEAAANLRLKETTNSHTKHYHPGAAAEYRTTRNLVQPYTPAAKPEMPVLMPGQQCTYNANGKLITHGAGAGTPDAYSPEVTNSWQELFSSNSHTHWDVNPFKPAGMTWQEYQKTWISNNGNLCLY